MTEMLTSHVADDEALYCRVLDGLYEIQEDGTVKFKTLAFSDRNFRTSVDRAKLCDNDAKRTLGSSSGGVVRLMACDVRAIDNLIQYDKDQKPLHTFGVDVEHVPIPDNPAHAEIHTKPDCSNSRVFKRLCERLVLLANASQWELKPPNLS